MKLPNLLRSSQRPPTEGVVRVALVRPARAVTVYVLMALQLVTLILLGLAFMSLYHRTMAVCEPLRQGQRILTVAPSGHEITGTFGHAADHLGCHR